MIHRGLNFFVLFLSLLPNASQGWINPTHSNNIRAPVAVEGVEADSEIPTSPLPSCSSSRRQWLSSAALSFTAAATVSPAFAATVAPPIVTSKNTCDVSVSVWNQKSSGRSVYILGTAHISSASALLAGDLVHDVNPNAVFVELDKKRVRTKNVAPLEELKTTSPAYDGNTVAVKSSDAPLMQGPVNDLPTSNSIPSSSSTSKKSSSPSAGVALGAAAVGTAIKGMYGKMSQEGFNPGEEFAVAMREGQAVGATIVLGDRDVDVTLQRLSQALRKTDLKKLLAADSEMETSMRELLPGQLPNDKDSAYKEELSAFVETMKAKETLKLVMAQLQQAAPEIYEAMVAERDAYMANGINKLDAFPVVVAVMGLAHVDGVENYLKNEGWTRAPIVCKDYSRQA